jgi:integrase
MLLLTCQRVNEIARAQWSEVDIDTAFLTVSEDRMKGGAIHTVPLVPLAFELLRGSPRFVGDDHVFSTTRGRMPFSGFSKAKARGHAFLTIYRREVTVCEPGWPRK